MEFLNIKEQDRPLEKRFSQPLSKAAYFGREKINIRNAPVTLLNM
jgi:hypothetical protein